MVLCDNRYRYSFNLIVLSLLLCVCLYDVLASCGFSFIDEFFVLFLYITWICIGKINKEFSFFIYIALFYLIYSCIQRTNILPAIISDFFVEIKPFVAYYTAYSLKIELTPGEQKKIRLLCCVLAISLLPIGINNLFGGNWILIFPGHTSRYASIYQILGFVYIAFSCQTNKDFRMTLLIMAGALLSGKSKAYGFYVILLLFVIYKESIIKKSLLSFKSILFAIVVFAAVIYVAKEKIYFFFIEGTENSDALFARPALYVAGWEILNDYPIFGSGLGSFASFYSGYYYSPIYYKYNLDRVYGLSPDNWDFVSDTFYPVLAQFGVIGISFYIIFWKRRIKSVFIDRKINNSRFIIVLLMIIMLAIESIADNTFIQNRGVYIMMLMGIVVSRDKMHNYSGKDK